MTNETSEAGILALLGLSAAILVGCSPSPETQVGNIRSTCSARSSADYYFPPTDEPHVLLSLASAYLTLADETSLSCGQTKSETYRMLYIGTTRFLVVRVAATDNVINLKYIEQIQPFPFNERARIDRGEKMLSPREWQELKITIESAGFWNEPGEMLDQNTLDSAVIVEGRRPISYRVLSRVGLRPDTNNIRMKIAPELLRLAGVDAPP